MRKLRRLARRFGRDGRGATAVEFALALPIFVPFLVAIFEVALLLLSSVMLENAAASASRDIRTGRIWQESDMEQAFRSSMCNSLVGLVDCSRVSYSVRVYSDYGAIPTSVQTDEDGDMEDTGFASSGAEDIVLVRVAYRYEFVTPLIGYTLSDNGTNSRLLVSSAILTNEPFQGLI